MKKQIAISLPLIFAAFVAYAASGDTGTPLTDAVEGAEKEPVEMCMLNGELVPEIEDDHEEDGKDSDDDANEAEDSDDDDEDGEDDDNQDTEDEVEPCDEVETADPAAPSNG